MSNWYDENIEPGVRDVVKLLRDNGFNTECSCEHDMYVQCRYYLDYDLFRLQKLLVLNGYENFRIELKIIVADGDILQSVFDVKLYKTRIGASLGVTGK